MPKVRKGDYIVTTHPGNRVTVALARKTGERDDLKEGHPTKYKKTKTRFWEPK